MASQSFESRKQKILEALALPDEEYVDLSPKGSVDAGILDLIRDINRLDGLVTTSSCAGRVSVFAEGGSTPTETPEDDERQDDGPSGDADIRKESWKFASTGGKGSGTWQFVSHDPVTIGDSESFLHDLFGLHPGNGAFDVENSKELTLVRFHFEPMILHVMAKSLVHAKPVLAAASNAGFRESGIQSLRCLDDSTACPIVAVRSSGLALESIIGYVERSNVSHKQVAHSLVSESYLRMMVSIANQRFQVNLERMGRFRTKLLAQSLGSSSLQPGHTAWEDSSLRRERKRAEGLKKREMLRQAAKPGSPTHESEDGLPLAFMAA
ncbi:hypothetical protein LOZ57_002618 [Ophidiomyces ophidiicola]|uniref:uncharacterized protein n=1 Tax=Ophidiomyces ophidiicola TaxID=1387563 RepID=UPI0020C4354F|nr:uncharacterized protein LOZ57_002618 [Ophidiomyces ophidiicola]KAI1949245.1 hypothetical protein LOZ57_002618 [Ophidiomyces ophidiicola]KAI2049102.1 hypothetical protein LOZ43_005228 [Ophidiomyces ophidiicola]